MKKTVKVLGIIPARGGSKRVPRKNIATIKGKPLIAYAIEAAKDSEVLDAFIVSTDDGEIAALAKKLGADVPFLRPKKFATDTSPDIEYLRHALEWLKEHRGWSPETIVMLPPDVPLRTGKDIDGVVRFMRKNKLDSVRTLVPLGYPAKALWTMGADAPRIAPVFPALVGKRSQEMPIAYVSVGIAYATRAEFINKGSLWGPKIGGYVVESGRGIEIDEPAQLRQAEIALRKRKT